jgi:hypothetical protein
MIYEITLVFDSDDDDTDEPQVLSLQEVENYAEALNVDTARSMRCYQGYRVGVGDGSVLKLGDELRVFAYTSEEDGHPVVQIDTQKDTDVHEKVRVYMNDSQATRWF